MSLVTCRSRSAKITPPPLLYIPVCYGTISSPLFRHWQLLFIPCVCAVRGGKLRGFDHVGRLVFRERNFFPPLDCFSQHGTILS